MSVGFFFLAVFSAALFAAIRTTALILRPLSRRADASTRKTQFTVSDIGCLMVYLSLLGGIASAIQSAAKIGYTDPTLVMLLPIALFELGGIWWLAVRQLSVNQVTGLWRRAIYQLCAVPLAILGPALAAACALITIPLATELDEVWPVAIMFAAALLAVVLVLADFRLVRWVAAGGLPSTAESHVLAVPTAVKDLRSPGLAPPA